VKVDFGATWGGIKPLHGLNNGPVLDVVHRMMKGVLEQINEEPLKS
jgi:hypothetical protein